MFRTSDILLIPFSLLWGGFAMFWEWTVMRIGAPFEFRLFGAPFVIIGLYIVFGRFLVDAYQRRRTAYGVSDRRAVIVTQILQRRTRSLLFGNLGEIELTEGRGGRGTLTCGRDALSGARGFAMRGWPGAGALAPSFECIDGAPEVLRIIRTAQRAH